MRTIHFFVMTLMLVLVQSGQVFAQSNNTGNSNGNNTNNGNPTNDPIYLVLLGEDETDLPRTATFPFEAYIQSETLTVSALCDRSDVSVTLYRGNDIVYQSVKDFVFMGSVTIPLSGMPGGQYTLLLTTLRGTYIYGTFEL